LDKSGPPHEVFRQNSLLRNQLLSKLRGLQVPFLDRQVRLLDRQVRLLDLRVLLHRITRHQDHSDIKQEIRRRAQITTAAELRVPKLGPLVQQELQEVPRIQVRRSRIFTLNLLVQAPVQATIQIQAL